MTTSLRVFLRPATAVTHYDCFYDWSYSCRVVRFHRSIARELIDAAAEKWLQHLSLSSPPSVYTLQFSPVSFYLVHQPIYLTVIRFFTTICFDFFLVTVRVCCRFVFFVFLFFLSFFFPFFFSFLFFSILSSFHRGFCCCCCCCFIFCCISFIIYC